VDSQIRQTLTQGIVSEYECRETARFSLTTWSDWLILDEVERAMRVAHKRVHDAIEANVSDAHMQHIERQSRRRRR
jgi:ribulose bisphosphate carboxylase small subunit